MKIIKTYKAQTEIINIIYKKVKDLDDLSMIETPLILDPMELKYEGLINICLYIRENHKVSFIIGSILTNLNLVTWYKALKIRKELN